jgi:hypothetical protein
MIEISPAPHQIVNTSMLQYRIGKMRKHPQASYSQAPFFHRHEAEGLGSPLAGLTKPFQTLVDLSNSLTLLQLGVFRLGLLEDGDVGVGVFPEREELFVGG